MHFKKKFQNYNTKKINTNNTKNKKNIRNRDMQLKK